MGVWDLRPKMEDEDGVPDVLLEDERVNEDRDVEDLEKRNEPNNAPSASCKAITAIATTHTAEMIDAFTMAALCLA